MFETYLTGQQVDPIKQRGLALALAGAAAMLSCLALLGWTAGKLSISAVQAPRFESPLTVPVQMSPPPSAAFPERPVAAASETPPPVAEEVVPRDSEADETAIDGVAKPEVPRRAVPGSALGGDGPGVLGTGSGPVGVAGGIGHIPDMRARMTPPRPSKPETTAISALRAVALRDPDPDPRKLRATRAASTGRPGQSEVSFCIDAAGRVHEVRTTRRFPGDPEVDRICRETVEGWRFRPFLAGGKPHRTCSRVSFTIEFE